MARARCDLGLPWIFALVACNALQSEEGIGKDPEKATSMASDKSGATPLQLDCDTYCSMQKKCFGGASRSPGWNASCKAQCKKDAKRGDDVAAFHAAVAACADQPCSKAQGACIADKLDALMPKGGEHRWDVRGAHPHCMRLRACVDAQVYDARGERAPLRSRLYREHRKMFVNLKKAKTDDGLACRMIVESEICAGRDARQPRGAPIAVDCKAYCANQKACFSKLTKEPTWDESCKAGCEAEAKLGTTVAAFFAAVASCRGATCGDAFYSCIAAKLDDHWPEGQIGDWDIRGLPKQCMHFVACTEAMYMGYDPVVVRTTREASYKSYAKAFANLRQHNQDPAKHCTTMLGYQPDCG